MSEFQDRDEAMDMRAEKVAALARAYPDPLAELRRENERLLALVTALRDPACPEAYGQRVTFEEFKRISADGP